MITRIDYVIIYRTLYSLNVSKSTGGMKKK